MARYYANTSNEVTALERENQELVRSLAGECMVLLENDGTLPLKADEKKIALYGNGARGTIKGGTGSGDVNSREVINIEDGLREAGFEITSGAWLDLYAENLRKAQTEYLAKLERIAKESGMPGVLVAFNNPFQEPAEPAIGEPVDADVAVYVIARNSGEGADRFNRPGDYLLSEAEENNIRFLTSHYSRTVILLNIGGIIDTKFLRSCGANALLLVGQTGNIGGRVVADVLQGLSVPSGKLTDTWAENYEDYPSSASFSHNNGNVDDEYYTEGIYVGYRYFDTFGIKPAYCFGYGCGYTSFEYSICGVTVDDGTVTVSVEVENTGDAYAGREVVQVYASAPAGRIPKPYQELKGFAKTKKLLPGEKETVEVSFAVSSMASYDMENAAWVLEKGDYVIRAGVSSRDTAPAAVIRLDAEACTARLENCFAPDHAYDEIRAPKLPAHEAGDAEVFEISAADIPTEKAVYQGERPVLEDRFPGKILTLEDVKSGKVSAEDLAAQLTVVQMASLCVGVYSGQDANVIGSASLAAPGAAGDTFPLEDRGIINLVMADGPAGLRLQPHFKTTKEGKLLKGGEVFGLSVFPFPEDTPEDAVDYYQYCTAIPIATTLAQSWDMELLEAMGGIVGKEMQQLHIHLWLAPGMNIHRNPLCGRNFEYYSEDPLLSGRCAAADTRGVQAFPGQGTTIKHFACNNLEDNRMFNNAHVSERALREIYLKGFETCVRESQPLALMTSYNLINGIHAANCKDLLQRALRDEWGFEGLVMTDWFTSQDVSSMGLSGPGSSYPISSSPQCIAAGNDIQMPGCQKNVDDIVEAVRKGKEITIGDLQYCTANILKVAAKCL